MLRLRCTSVAAERLDRLRNQPTFENVLKRLERVQGPIYLHNVERALLESFDEPIRH